MKYRRRNHAFGNDDRRSGRRRSPAWLTFDRLEGRPMLDAALGSEILPSVPSASVTSHSRPPTAEAEAGLTATTISLNGSHAFELNEDVGVGIVVTPDPLGGVPTGEVEVSVDGGPPSHLPLTPVATLNVATAVARFARGTLAVGDHTVSVRYLGNSDFASSVADPFDLKVVRVTSDLSFQLTPSPPAAARAGDTVVANVIVDSLGQTPQTGTVALYDGDRLIGTEPVVFVAVKSYSNSTDGPYTIIERVTGQATFTIPAASLGGGEHRFTARYSGDAMYEPEQATSEPLVVDAPPLSTAGPHVVGVERFGYHMMPTSIVVQFDGSLDPSRAQDPSNYHLTNALGRPLRLRSATYDPVARTVTLSPAQRLGINRRYQLTIDGIAETGLSNPAGYLLDGDADGTPGGDYIARIDHRNLVLPPRPAVSRRVPPRPVQPQTALHPLAHHPRPIRPTGHRIQRSP